MKYTCLTSVFLILLMCFVCTSSFSAEFNLDCKPDIFISYNENVQKTSYKLNYRNKCFSIETHDENSINSTVMGFYTHYGFSLRDQIQVLPLLIKCISRTEPKFKRIRTLDWGKVTESDVLVELITTAVNSKRWKSYLETKGDNNRLVLDLLIESDAFRLLKSTFVNHDMILKESSVEKVTLCKVKKLKWIPAIKDLLEKGIVLAEDEVPYSMLLHFDIVHK